LGQKETDWEELKRRYPEKFWTARQIFGKIHPGDRIFVGTGCGEPQHLVGALRDYVEIKPRI